MNTVTQRILLTVFGIPLFFSSIFFFPQGNYAALNVIIIIFSVLGSYEMHAMLSFSEHQRSLFHPLFAGLLPVTAYIQLYLFPSYHIIAVSYIVVFFMMMVYETLRGSADEFQGSITRMAYSLFHLLYPSLITVFVVYLTAFDHASIFIIYLFIMIFSNDVFAYIFGILFGKSTRGIIQVSPNKSITGFIGGFFMTIVSSIIVYLLIPQLHQYGSLSVFIILSVIISLFANAGDLVESALKRSSRKKDSGTIIPGRGGVLDTIDSIIFCAPVYYYFIIYILKV